MMAAVGSGCSKNNEQGKPEIRSQRRTPVTNQSVSTEHQTEDSKRSVAEDHEGLSDQSITESQTTESQSSPTEFSRLLLRLTNRQR